MFEPILNSPTCCSHPDNPVLCRHDLDQLIQLLNAQEARLKGLAHCLVRQEELAPPVHDMLITPLPNIVQSLLQQLPVAPIAIIQENPSIVQVIMPVATIAQSSDEPTTTILGHNVNEPAAEPLGVPVTTVQPPASVDASETEAVESTTTIPVAPLTTTMLSNFIQSSHTPLGVLTRIAPAVAAYETTSTPAATASWTPVPTTTLSNIIQSLDDEIPPESLLQLAQQQPDGLEAAAFDDIQPSDIVTLPDLLPPAAAALHAEPPPPWDDLVDVVQAMPLTPATSTPEHVDADAAPEQSDMPADPSEPPPPDNSRATADATTQT